MFVYTGKLTWHNNKIHDETFVIVLPNGPVRVGDNAYLFTQWTVDVHGASKTNWFQNLVVSKVTKNKNGEDAFTFKHHSDSYEIHSEEGYSKLHVALSKGHAKSTMHMKRIYQSQGDQSTATGRIWTGKANWLKFAVNEMAMFIAPEGFGEGKPIISVWQFTQDSAGKKNDPSPRVATQKIEAGAAKGTVKFSYHSYYDISCTWDERTEKLAVQMSENGGEKKALGEMSLAARIERSAHGFNPPEPAPKKKELEVRLPQAQDSLPRILTPMPFPKGLLDTLAHTAAFVDQAGYLAKYANEKFAALDADFHARGRQLDAAKAETKSLGDTVKKLTDDLNMEKSKTTDLEEQLNKTREAAEAEKQALLAQVQKLQDYINKDAVEDQVKLNILEDTRKQLAEEKERATSLQKELDDSVLATKSQESELDTKSARITELELQLSELRSDHKVVVDRVAKLKDEVDEVTASRDETKSNLEMTTELFNDAADDLKRVEAELSRELDSFKRINSELSDLKVTNAGLREKKDKYQRLLIQHKIKITDA